MLRMAIRVALILAVLFILFTTIALADGKTIFLTTGCDTCHSVPTAGIKGKVDSQKAPDLVNLSARYTVEELRALLHQERKINGKIIHRREFKGNEDLLTEMIDWLMKQRTKDAPPPVEESEEP